MMVQIEPRAANSFVVTTFKLTAKGEVPDLILELMTDHKGQLHLIRREGEISVQVFGEKMPDLKEIAVVHSLTLSSKESKETKPEAKQ